METSALDALRASGRATISPAEAARILHLDPRTVRRACQEGSLPAIKIGSRTLIPTARLLSMLTGEAA